jgi:ABC-2 type transport system ATP-binding protein
MGFPPVAEFENVTKSYPLGFLWRRTLQALSGVSFRVEAGEVCGIVGPNRAGKTTLVKLLLALCQPTAGVVRRFGAPASDRRTLAKVGYVHESQAFPRYLSATDLLHYHGALALLPEAQVRLRVPELLEQVGLADRGRERVSSFSKGMTQRLALALALLNDCELLVLDEPVEGLDQSGRLLLRDVITGQRERGRTVLMVSHLLPEVERLCDRVVVLVGGRVAYAGPVDRLTRDPDTGRARPLELTLEAFYEEPSPWTPLPSCTPVAG